MGNEIGNYVHSKLITYQIFGISRPGMQTRQMNAFQALSAEEKSLNSLISMQRAKEKNASKTDIKNMEKLLNDLLYTDVKKGGLKGSFLDEKIRETVTKILQDIYGAGIEIGPHLGVYNSLKKREKYDENSVIPKSEIIQLMNAVNSLTRKAKGEDLEWINEIQKKLESFINQAELKGKRSDLKIKFKNRQDIIQVLNEAQEIINFPPMSAIGDASEYYKAGLGVLINNFGLKKLSELTKEEFTSKFGSGHGKQNFNTAVKKSVTGKDRFEVGIDLSNVDEGVAEALKKEMGKTLNESGSLGPNCQYDIKTNETQGKSDFTLTWQNGNVTNFSVKNYSLRLSSQQISLLGEGSFYFLLQGEKVPYINHYLNLITLSDGSSYINTIMNQYHQVTKMMLFIKALSGRGIKGREVAEADYLILNARNGNNQGVHIYPMSELMENASKSLDAINFKGYPPEIINQRIGVFDNPSDANTRIAKLIHSLYSSKITIKMMQQFLFY